MREFGARPRTPHLKEGAMRGIFPGIVYMALGLLLGLAPALAQEKPAAPAPAPLPTPARPVQPDNAILAFVKSNPDCTELTDECIICAVVSGKAMCSTPGIACVRKDLRCVTTKPPTPKQ
jgi:hypothetical protein